MLKHIRRLLALVVFLGLNWLFLDFTGSAQHCVGWMAKLQLLPALLAFNWVVVIVLVAITVLMGRIYCSVICPLGIMQDIISWISGKLKLDKNKRRFGRFAYENSKGLNILRYTLFGLFVVCLFAGFGTFVQLLAPYSSFGRIVTMLLQPLYEMGNNLLADRSEAAGNFDYYQVDVWMRSMPVFIIAAVTFVVIFIMAWIGGRFYCNRLCPVGTLLGILSAKRVVGIDIKADKCKSCRLCERACKSSAIFIPNRDQKQRGLVPAVDSTRCVDCFNCIDTCQHGALSFSRVSCPSSDVQPVVAKETNDGSASNEANGPTRRAFLAATATVLGASLAKAQEKTTDGGLAAITGKKRPERKQPICPPGAISLKNMQTKCTGCQLCVSECPNDVLRPSNDLMHMMMPTSSYERGFCRPECTRCSDVCPAGAIVKFPGDEKERRAVKSSTKIGTAHWIAENCIVNTDGVSCGLCSRRCPTSAIKMVLSDPDDRKSLRIPAVDEERCIGCGACENLCPSRPFSAIYVEGIDVQREI